MLGSGLLPPSQPSGEGHPGTAGSYSLAKLPRSAFDEKDIASRGDGSVVLDYNQERPHQGLHNLLPAGLYLGKEMTIEHKNAIHLIIRFGILSRRLFVKRTDQSSDCEKHM